MLTAQNIEKIIKTEEMHSSPELITPEKAQRILDLQPKNRKIIQRKVNEYTDLMISGQWEESHPQGLVFNTKGDLINGQHRLLAVVKAGIPIRFYCTFNADDRVKVLLDSATPRTVDQTGQILGLDTSPLKTAIARALFIKIEDKKIGRGLPVQKILDVYEKYSKGIDLASIKNGSNSISTAIIRVVIARAYYHCSEPDKLKHFVEVLDTGFSISKQDSSAIVLRNLYLQMSARKLNSAAGKISLFRKSLTAVHKYLEGVSVKNLAEAKIQYFPLDLENEANDYQM